MKKRACLRVTHRQAKNANLYKQDTKERRPETG